MKTKIHRTDLIKKLKFYITECENLKNFKRDTENWLELDKPIHYGWYVYLDFRDDIKQREDYPMYVKAINYFHNNILLKPFYTMKSNISLTELTKIIKLHIDHDYESIIKIGSEKISVNCNRFNLSMNSIFNRISNVSRIVKLEEFEKSGILGTKYFNKVLVNDEYRYVMGTVPKYWFTLRIEKRIVKHLLELNQDIESKLSNVYKELDSLYRILYNSNRKMRVYNRVDFKKLTRKDIYNSVVD